ncbi:hypothetical protein L1049_003455 [Liquidambar formosana]|uniref:Uncharacterized protein n=1 Tax=Liquidambar formosana TaxID=63359 RepID=A0AAP0N7F9_LIQFO
MSSRLFQAIFRNDTHAFTSLVQENQNILKQKTAGTTALHLASRFGYVEMVREIVKYRPDMVAAFNGELETPLHEACSQGNLQVLIVLLEADPLAACNLNYKSQSALFKACSNGHLDLVKLLLLKTPRLLDLEDNGIDQTSLHVASSRGHTEYILNETTVDINLQNNRGYTVYEILNRAGSNLKIHNPKDMLEKAEGRRTGIETETEIAADIDEKGRSTDVAADINEKGGTDTAADIHEKLIKMEHVADNEEKSLSDSDSDTGSAMSIGYYTF